MANASKNKMNQIMSLLFKAPLTIEEVPKLAGATNSRHHAVQIRLYKLRENVVNAILKHMRKNFRNLTTLSISGEPPSNLPTLSGRELSKTMMFIKKQVLDNVHFFGVNFTAVSFISLCRAITFGTNLSRLTFTNSNIPIRNLPWLSSALLGREKKLDSIAFSNALTGKVVHGMKGYFPFNILVQNNLLKYSLVLVNNENLEVFLMLARALSKLKDRDEHGKKCNFLVIAELPTDNASFLTTRSGGRLRNI